MERVLGLEKQPLPGPHTAVADTAGPGYQILFLCTSAESWEDRSQTDEVWDHFDRGCLVLAESLAQVWGPPERIELGPVLERSMRGEAVSALAGVLSNFVPSLSAWHFDDRTVCVGVGQWDAEFPITLVAAAGDLAEPIAGPRRDRPYASWA
ncbi:MULTISPECIES: hypothetical protein [Micromonospora]|uniref:hypothetical protein n=1 Tax=Micromonospora TaxID=1873 RepID=UPI001E4B5F3D|nr:hypothetical protein [Micromonospora sp. NBRC 110038]